LKREVGPVLAQAFAELTITQPADTIAFIGEWLNTYVTAQQAQQLVDAEKAHLKADRKAYQAEKAKIDAEKKAIADAIAAKEKAVTSISEELDTKFVAAGDEAAPFVFTEATEEDPDPAAAIKPAEPVTAFEQLYSDLAEKAQSLTGARGVYIAKVEAEQQVLHFTYTAKATSDLATNITGDLKYTHDFMLDVTYKKQGERKGPARTRRSGARSFPRSRRSLPRGKRRPAPHTSRCTSRMSSTTRE
jgi:seryl-tRNA synthetase